MKPQKLPPPNQNEWERLPFDVQLYITARIFLAVELPRITESILKFLYRVDLWLFPPLIFALAYITAYRNFPQHPMMQYAILSIAFMAATLTLFLIRPPKRRKFHWVKA